MNRKWGWMAGGLALLALLLAGVFILAQEPRWNPAYFTPVHQERYATVESTLQEYVAALGETDPARYNEVLGYESSLSAEDFPLYSGPTPGIEELKIRGNWAFVWTDNRWECYFRRVQGRWVFWPEDWRALIRWGLAW